MAQTLEGTQKSLGTRWVHFNKKEKVYQLDSQAPADWTRKATREEVTALSPTEFGQYCHQVSTLCAKPAKAFNGGGVYHLTMDSAKVIHSGKVERWFNVVQYLSPADRALVSFIKEFGEKQVYKLIREVKKAGPAWRGFAASESRIEQIIAAMKTLQKEKLYEDFVLPLSANSMGMCPYASPVCRAVCLNTSGRAGMVSVKEDSKLYKDVIAFMKQDGLFGKRTLNDLLMYYYLRGKEAYYGGEDNINQAMRARRTHLVWNAWANQGVIRNKYNDGLFLHALEFKKYADKAGVPMALRLNGTSDMPVETLELTNGKNLITSLSEVGIQCYDYTKNHDRMNTFLSGDMPGNYYLCFSWSEVNYKKAVQVLDKGGNVIMVLRRSTTESGARALPKKAGYPGAFPTWIDRKELTGAGAGGWPIVSGDTTDLRFADPRGCIVALMAKGKAGYEFTEDMANALNKRFTMTGIVEDGKLLLRENPAPIEGGAILAVDEGLLRELDIPTLGGWALTSTAMGS